MRNLLQRLRKLWPVGKTAAGTNATVPIKRRRRRILWGSLGVLAIAIPVALWFLPSPVARYFILQQMRTAGLSTADIGEVNVSLFGGQLGVRRTRANAPEGPEARLADLDVMWEWRPLFDRRVSLGNVAMRGLQLEISHRPDGRLMISGLPLPDAVATPGEEHEGGWLIGIDKMQISESSLVYIRNTQRITLAIDLLVVEQLRAWAPEAPGRLDFVGSFNGAPVAVNGEFAPFAARQNAQLKLQASGIDIARIATIFADPELYELRGTLDFDLAATASITPGASVEAVFDGKAEAREMVMGLADVKLRADRFGWNGNIRSSPVDAAAAGTLTADGVTIDTPEGAFALASAAASAGPVAVRFGGVPQIGVDWKARLDAAGMRFKSGDTTFSQDKLSIAVAGTSDGPKVALTAGEVAAAGVDFHADGNNGSLGALSVKTERLEADFTGPEVAWDGRIELHDVAADSGKLNLAQDKAVWDGKAALHDGNVELSGELSLADTKLGNGDTKAAIASLKAALKPLKLAGGEAPKLDWKGRIELGTATLAAPGFAAAPAKLVFDGAAQIDMASAPRGRVTGKLESGRTRTTLPGAAMWVEHQSAAGNTTLTLNGKTAPTAQTTLAVNGLTAGSSAGPHDLAAIARIDLDNIRLLADGGVSIAAVRVNKLQSLQRRKQGKDAGYPWRAEIAKTTITNLARSANGDITAAAVDLDGFTARVTNSATGLHGLDAMPAAAPAPPPRAATPPRGRAAAPPPPANGPRVAVGRFEVKGNSRILFEDLGTSPVVRLTAPVTLRIDQLDSGKPAQLSPLRATARHGDFGELRLTGNLRPFAPKLNLDMKANMKGFSLPVVSPYAAQMLGVHLQTGRFDGEIAMKVIDEKLDGTTTLKLSNLELAEVQGDAKLSAGTGMPIETIVGLLRDGDGIINLNIPIAGELSDPQFDLNDAIGQAVTGAIRNTASTLLSVVFPVAGLIEAAEEEQTRSDLGLKPIDYTPGSADLSDTQRTYLTNLAKLLGQRPGLRLNICGYAATRDWPAIHAARVVAAEAAAAPKTSVGIAARQTGDWLRKSAGISKEPPPPPPPPEEDALRELAGERSRSVKLFIAQNGAVAEERLFECRPEVELDDAAKPRVVVKL
jgi:hypothetical protein